MTLDVCCHRSVGFLCGRAFLNDVELCGISAIAKVGVYHMNEPQGMS